LDLLLTPSSSSSRIPWMKGPINPQVLEGRSSFLTNISPGSISINRTLNGLWLGSPILLLSSDRILILDDYSWPANQMDAVTSVKIVTRNTGRFLEIPTEGLMEMWRGVKRREYKSIARRIFEQCCSTVHGVVQLCKCYKCRATT
jgi:hypothetical protein